MYDDNYLRRPSHSYYNTIKRAVKVSWDVIQLSDWRRFNPEHSLVDSNRPSVLRNTQPAHGRHNSTPTRTRQGHRHNRPLPRAHQSISICHTTPSILRHHRSRRTNPLDLGYAMLPPQEMGESAASQNQKNVR